ncbi:MAG: rod shape-determining protein RodA [Spirochaetota bacterium]
MRTRSLFGFDLILFFSTMALLIIGILFIYSSSVSSTGIVFSREYIRQIIWAGTGFILVFTVIFIGYDRFQPWSPYIYASSVLLLIITLLFGQPINGAKSWLGILDFGIQPSEFTKIAVILFLAGYYTRSRNRMQYPSHFLIGFFIILIPVFLVLLQPDMGTAIVYIPIFLIMSFVGGVPVRYVIFVFITGLLLIILSLLPAWQDHIVERDIPFLTIVDNPTFIQYSLLSLGVITLTALAGYFLMKKKYFYWIIYVFLIVFLSLAGSSIARMVLKEYQIMRLIVFLNPGVDPKGAGWNIIQSITAVGSGGFFGKGFLKGTQSHYRYLPQQSTDFIFSIISEEWGFLGGFLVFSLFVTIMIRGLLIIQTIKDSYAVLVGSGVVAMLLFHFVVNIGMAMGIMPITGIPLFFLSYGGSSLWTAMLGIGLLLSIHLKRYSY